MVVHSARVDVANGDVTSAPFSGAESSWNEYQNEYQTDSDRYVPTFADKHGFIFEMRQKGQKKALNGRLQPSSQDSGGYNWIQVDYPGLRVAGTGRSP
jgi:hypothetical protein